ncbi:hypothetical protein KR067_002906 [Drosophila pandora]|nr:hypothetical protein KR067_002906 [Drosophila pandora]
MNSPDQRLYMCSSCFERCHWYDLSKKEHHCPRCRLPPKFCANCDQQFEPREKTVLYCKRCDFYMQKNAAVRPQVLDRPEEESRTSSSFAERWQEIKTVTGIVDDMDDMYMSE